jgi:ABC-type microcin C transport system duplicated ATPase subunit YejF
MTNPSKETAALTVERLVKTFDVSAPWLNRVIERKPRQYLQAVNDISFTVPAGGCLSIVGESGCDKRPNAVCAWQKWCAINGADDISGPLCLAQSSLARQEHHR